MSQKRDERFGESFCEKCGWRKVPETSGKEARSLCNDCMIWVIDELYDKFYKPHKNFSYAVHD